MAFNIFGNHFPPENHCLFTLPTLVVVRLMSA